VLGKFTFFSPVWGIALCATWNRKQTKVKQSEIDQVYVKQQYIAKLQQKIFDFSHGKFPSDGTRQVKANRVLAGGRTGWRWTVLLRFLAREPHWKTETVL
jgi:hypothetical protein